MQRLVWERVRHILVLHSFEGDQTMQARIRSEEGKILMTCWVKTTDSAEASMVNDHVIPGEDC